jgi:NDP-sugar pyrophosphorylase family protein
MLLLGGKPILEHIINRAKAAGIMEFVLAIHHLGEVIEEYFGNGQFLGVNISYIKEKSPLGTAGALGLIDPKPTKPVVVANGDVLTDIRFGDILEFHSQNDAMATMAVQVYESENPFGVVQTKGISITGYEEKPIIRSLVNAGVYVLNPSALDFLEKDAECSMPTLFEILRTESLNTIAFPLHENWLDLGSPSDLAKATEEIQSTQRTRN